MAHHHSEIILKVDLDENKVPEAIHWSATDGGVNLSEAKATLLSVWDAREGDTLRIDLWTKDMMADEMKRLIHQTLLGLSDTLERSINEKEAAKDMRNFARQLGEKLELFKK